MNYIELKNKLQKTLSILENKHWPSREKLECAAIISVKDFWESSGLPLSEVDASNICFVMVDYPSERECLYTYQFVFKPDKRKPDGCSDYLLQVVLEPVVAEKFWEMDIWELYDNINHHAGVLHNEQRLLEEKELFVKKINKIDEELKFIKEVLEKY